MSENVSSNVLFHFTKSMNNLKGILKHGFFPRYCLEYTFDRADSTAAAEKRSPMRAAPLVSFCDLPLSLIHKHLQEYGPFGIGLHKKWGIGNGVTRCFTHTLKHEPASPYCALSPERPKPLTRQQQLTWSFWLLIQSHLKVTHGETTESKRTFGSMTNENGGTYRMFGGMRSCS